MTEQEHWKYPWTVTYDPDVSPKFHVTVIVAGKVGNGIANDFLQAIHEAIQQARGKA